MFENDSVNFDLLKKEAFNYRWAEVPEGVIPLTAADSDFPVAPELIRGLIDRVSTGYFPYPPKLGYPEVGQSIANQFKLRKDEDLDPSLILPVDSAARGMYIIAEAVLEPGDEAIVFDPVDYLFVRSTRAAGANPIYFPARLKDGRIDLTDLESYITPKTRMIGLCNPHNPLGVLYSREDLQTILDLAEAHDLYIMNDEIWSDIVYSGSKFTSILNIDPSKNHRVISVYGFSKSFGIAGLRVGCVYCSTEEMFRRLVEVSDVMSTAGGVASLSQYAAQICMDECYYWNEDYVRHLESNRDYALERISRMPGITCHKPEATFMLFPNISATALTSAELADFLVKKVNLAVVPGSAEFFGPGAEGHIRISLATSREILEEGMNRLEAGLNLLVQHPERTNLT